MRTQWAKFHKYLVDAIQEKRAWKIISASFSRVRTIFLFFSVVRLAITMRVTCTLVSRVLRRCRCARALPSKNLKKKRRETAHSVAFLRRYNFFKIPFCRFLLFQLRVTMCGTKNTRVRLLISRCGYLAWCTRCTLSLILNPTPNTK